MSVDCTSVIPADPDISGIGIRTSVYVTTIVLSLIPRIPETKELNAALSTAAGLQAMALTITALVQTKSGDLTLYHAVIIFHLLVFLGLNVNHTGRYTESFPRVLVHSLGTWVALLLFFAWVLRVWSTAPVFGPAELRQCNDQIQYVIFFKSISATTTWMRWLFVGLASAGLFLFVLIPPLTTFLWLITRALPAPHNATRDANSASKWVSDRSASLRFLASIYSAVTLELVVSRNRAMIVSEAEAEWGFGQIAAMVILLSPINELLHAFLSFLAFHGEPGARRVGLARAFFRIIPFGSYWAERHYV